MSNSKMIIEDNDKKTLILTAISGVFLLLSLITDIKLFGIDLSWGAIIISGLPVIIHSTKSLVLRGNVRAGLLISIAVIACVAVGEYFAAGEVVFIMALGELLEDYTVRRARAGLKELISMKPSTARVQKDGEYCVVAASEVKVGDIIRVNAGETIPVDGMITEGSTCINQAVITGESIPVDKKSGDDVFCATINEHGSILMKATKVGDDSSLVKMINLISEAEKKKAPIIRVMDKWASCLVIVALLLSVIVGFATGDIIRGITVLVVFCPCALVLATPTAIAAGIGNATRQGIIIKSGEALEALGRIKRVVLDKTGTLTTGEPEVKDVIVIDSSTTETELLKLTARAELHSEHPLGMAIVKAAEARGVSIDEPESFKVHAGNGVEAVIGKNKYWVGKPSFINERVAVNEECKELIKRKGERGYTVSVVARDECIIGIITLADSLRKDSEKAIALLKRMGKKLTILTGDSKAVAAKISEDLSIDDYKAELLPADKLSVIDEHEKTGDRCCMVGDGINDAPALKAASAGIAMAGIGSDIAADAADIILMEDEIGKLPYVLNLSEAVSRKIFQNITLSLILNFGAIGLAAAGLLGPVSGALMHNVSSVLVVLNAAMLLSSNFTVNNLQEENSLESQESYLVQDEKLPEAT